MASTSVLERAKLCAGFSRRHTNLMTTGSTRLPVGTVFGIRKLSRAGQSHPRKSGASEEVAPRLAAKAAMAGCSCWPQCNGSSAHLVILPGGSDRGHNVVSSGGLRYTPIWGDIGHWFQMPGQAAAPLRPAMTSLSCCTQIGSSALSVQVRGGLL